LGRWLESFNIFFFSSIIRPIIISSTANCRPTFISKGQGRHSIDDPVLQFFPVMLAIAA
jgi:hypothetical protein